MGITEKPATYRYTCDGCGNWEDHEAKVAWPRHWGMMILRQDAHDFQGNAVADGTVSRLLCRSCIDIVSSAVNKAIELTKRGDGTPQP